MLDVGCWLFLLSAFSASSALGQTNTNALQTLAPAYGELPPTFWERYGVGILIITGVLVVAAGVVVWRKLSPAPAPVVAPETIARGALAQLQHRPEDGKLLSEVSQILRRYAGAIFGFPGAEMTTTEFTATVAAGPGIDSQLAEALANFLRACDQGKFMAQNEAPPLNAVERAMQLIEQIENRRKEPAALKSSSR